MDQGPTTLRHPKSGPAGGQGAAGLLRRRAAHAQLHSQDGAAHLWVVCHVVGVGDHGCAPRVGQARHRADHRPPDSGLGERGDLRHGDHLQLVCIRADALPAATTGLLLGHRAVLLRALAHGQALPGLVLADQRDHDRRHG